jgi:hypothetical protein
MEVEMEKGMENGKFIHSETLLKAYLNFHKEWKTRVNDAVLKPVLPSDTIPPVKNSILQFRAIPPVKKLPTHDIFDSYDNEFMKVINDTSLVSLQIVKIPEVRVIKDDNLSLLTPNQKENHEKLIRSHSKLSSSWKEIDLSSLRQGTPEYNERLVLKATLFCEHQEQMCKLIAEQLREFDMGYDEVLRRQRRNFAECERREQEARAKNKKK